LDNFELTTHKAYFVPESISLGQQQGLSYIVRAELEVEPLDVTDDYVGYVLFYNEFGPDWKNDEDFFNLQMNNVLPGIL
jgi:fructosamine-3-kinase